MTAVTAGTDRHEVIVVGGGMIGAATSYYLAKAGVDVRLLERGFLGREASGRNAGTFNLLNDRIVDDKPLALLKKTLERWRGLSDELEFDLEVNLDKGTVLVGETEADYGRLLDLKSVYAGKGIELDLLDRAALSEFAPYISPKVHAALFCGLGGLANPRNAAWAYARKAKQFGATVTEEIEVLDITPADGGGYRVETNAGVLSAHKVVLSNGPWTKAFVERYNVNIPLRIRYFQVSVTDVAPFFIKHGIRRVGGMLTLKQTARGNCILGGGWEGISEFPHHGRVDFSTVSQNCAIAARIVPGFGERSLLRTWAGYDGSSIDEQPVMDEVPGHPGLIISTGSSGGFTHGPVFGEMTADLVMGRSHLHEMDRFLLARFAHLQPTAQGAATDRLAS